MKKHRKKHTMKEGTKNERINVDYYLPRGRRNRSTSNEKTHG
jgi:hypothetical protein